MIPDTTPQREKRSCPICSADGIALVAENTGVVWCEYGHVSVFSPEIGSYVVYDFSLIKPLGL